MKYDDASWHYGGNFPSDLPPEAGATHIAMFVFWAWLNGLAGELHVEEFPDDLKRVRQRHETPAKLFIAICDEKFTSEDLNEEGNLFASSYYGDADGLRSGAGGYLNDYGQLFPDDPSGYHVPDTWESFDRVASLISNRFNDWRRERT